MRIEGSEVDMCVGLSCLGLKRDARAVCEEPLQGEESKRLV